MSERCAKFVQTHSRKLPPNFCARIVPHNFCTISAHFFEARWQVSHKFSGTSRDYPAYKFCTTMSDTWRALKICLCTGKLCLKPREEEKIKSSEQISGTIGPYGGKGIAGKTSKTISTIAILWLFKAIESRRGPLRWR